MERGGYIQLRKEVDTCKLSAEDSVGLVFDDLVIIKNDRHIFLWLSSNLLYVCGHAKQALYQGI
jgi:hypothetical protein